MRVVDTSAWIEWLIGGPLRKTLRKEFPDKAQCVVPTIVQLELAKWLFRAAGRNTQVRIFGWLTSLLDRVCRSTAAPIPTRSYLR